MRRLGLAIALGVSGIGAAQSAPPIDPVSATRQQVLAAETGFWSAFDRCDAAAMARFFTADAEFYHDKTGLTTTRAGIVASMISGPCSNAPADRFRREAVPGTERFDALAGGFAMLTGEQRFVAAGDQQSGIAGYVEIWQDTPDGWQMRRVVSYDHRPEGTR